MKWDGEKISRPGIYDGIPLERYHSNICIGPSISSSGLRLIDPTLGKTPRHYWESSCLNPNAEPQEPKTYYTLGQAAHMLFLGQTGFDKTFVVRPDPFNGAPWQGNRKDCKQWVAQQRLDGKLILTPEDIKIVRGMRDSIAKHPVAPQLLNGEIEQSLFFQDRKTGVWIKVRPDAIPIDSNMVDDLKTIAESDDRSCEQAIIMHGYFIQLALIEMAMMEVLGREVTDHVLIFVSKSSPYLVNVKPVDRLLIDCGRQIARRAIDIFAACLKSGEWTGWPHDGEMVMRPEWLVRKLDKEVLAKELPTLEETYL